MNERLLWCVWCQQVTFHAPVGPNEWACETQTHDIDPITVDKETAH